MAVTAPPSADAELEDRLDQLIPPSMPSVGRLAVSAGIVALAIAITVLNIGGWFYPRPTALGSYSSGGSMWADPDRGLVAGEVMLPNWSERDLRITEVTLDAPGARLADVRVYLEPEAIELVDGDAVDGETATDEVSSTEPWPGRLVEEAVGLPVTVPADRTAWLVLWFEPERCDDQPGPWGVAEVTLDFGAGAFPPFARTVRLDDDPIVDSFDRQASVLVDGELVLADGPLAAACEALR